MVQIDLSDARNRMKQRTFQCLSVIRNIKGKTI